MDFKNLRDRNRRFFLVIYPETEAEVSGKHCGGGSDLGLSESGMEQGRALSQKFKKNPLKIKKIFASPELRTVQMADLLHDEIKAKLNLVRDFSDQFLGDLEGQAFRSGESARTVISLPLRGESDEVFSLRVRRGLERVLEDGLVSLVVVHPRVSEQIQNWLGLQGTVERNKIYLIEVPMDSGLAVIREA